MFQKILVPFDLSDASKISPEDQEWLDKGVDIFMIRENLKRSYEERAEQHQTLIDSIEEFKKIGREHREKDSRTS